MSQATIAILILLAAVVLFITEILPVSVTSILAMLAMGVFGVISWSDAFSGMSNSIIFFLIGTAILGESFFSTGLADVIGHQLLRLSRHGFGERGMILILFIVGAVTSAFFNGAMIIAVLFPIIDSIAASSNGSITRKNLYLPTAVSTVLGSNVTIIGSTSMMLAVRLLAESDFGYSMSFFEPFWIGIPGNIIAIIAFMTFAYRMEQKYFDFPDVRHEMPHDDDAAQPKMTGKCWFVVVVTVLTILAVALGYDYGAAAMICAVVLIATKCIDVKAAYSGVCWDTIFVVAGSLGFAKGINASGAGREIADFVIGLCGPLSSSAGAMCIVILFLATLISNFMSNGAAVSIVAPIGIALASSLGVSAIPFVLATAVGANLSLATPICVTQITMCMSAGYRSKDIFRVGGLINLLAFAVTAAALWLVYYI